MKEARRQWLLVFFFVLAFPCAVMAADEVENLEAAANRIVDRVMNDPASYLPAWAGGPAPVEQEKKRGPAASPAKNGESPKAKKP